MSHKDGDEYHASVTHRNFTFLSTGKEARVYAFIHKRWAHLSPHITPIHGGKCKDVQTLLSTHSDHIPPLAFMVGDFNLRHE